MIPQQPDPSLIPISDKTCDIYHNSTIPSRWFYLIFNFSIGYIKCHREPDVEVKYIDSWCLCICFENILYCKFRSFVIILCLIYSIIVIYLNIFTFIILMYYRKYDSGPNIIEHRIQAKNIKMSSLMYKMFKYHIWTSINSGFTK